MSRTQAALSLLVLLLGTLVGAEAHAQCILANPSFEMLGSPGQTFEGWQQFGSVGSTAQAAHGHLAARVSGPNLGGWDVSGYWQPQDSAPGERWVASVRAWHSSTRPLTGQSRAILNIEWRNSGGYLISYESHTVADASTTRDLVRTFSVTSQPAPAGTVSARFLLGVLQGPGDPVPDVYYDQATFDRFGPPSLEDLQWGDFSGGRTVVFSGRSWRVKGPGYYGPGPNHFCNTASCTWADAEDRLHLTVKKIGSTWYSSEVALQDVLGYGDYIFTTVGRLDLLHQNVVFGMFLWQYGPCYDASYGWWNPYNEIDVEFSRWGNPGTRLGQFVAQPYDYPGNLSGFGVSFGDQELTSHAFRWLPDRVEYRSWRGGPQAEATSARIHSWTYTGPHIPRPEIPRVHINLWQATGAPTVNQEVILDAFTFVPACSSPPCVVGVPEDPPPPSAPVAGLTAAAPNPANPRTTISFSVPKDAVARIRIYDIAGRQVRTLVDRFYAAGAHETVWDGRDDAGTRLASGVYLYRFQTGEVAETKRLVLVW